MPPSHDIAAPGTNIGESQTTPLQWPWALSAAPAASSEATGWKNALLRRWRGTSAVMVQPPLDQHYIVMHLGGAKRVTRTRDGAPVSTIAERGSLTFVPARTAFTWHTSGPIAFAHLYLRPQQLDDVMGSEFDLEGRGATLVERVGFRDPQLERLLGRMIEECESRAHASSLLLDSLLESLLIRMARSHASRVITRRSRTLALAPHRLQRVLEFIDANLGREIDLADLVAAAGSSQFHFSHAFHAAAGCSPYRYLIERRIEYAKVLLMTGNDPLSVVSLKCGFNSQHQFAVMFKRAVGVGPKRYCLKYRSPARDDDSERYRRSSIEATPAIEPMARLASDSPAASSTPR